MWQAAVVGQEEITAEEGWRRVYDLAMERWDDVGQGQPLRVLYKLSVSEGAYLLMKKGLPLKRIKSLTKVCKALGWTSNSIDLIRAGEAPLIESDMILAEVENATPEELERRLAEVTATQKVLRRRLRQLLRASPEPPPTD